jgi:hypothetical protein
MPLAGILATRTSAVTAALDDGSDGWLISVQQGAAAIASILALSLATLAAAQQPYIPDELPIISVDEAYAPVQAPPVIPPWALPQLPLDADYAPAITVDEQGPIPVPAPAATWNLFPLPIDADQLPSQLDEIYAVGPQSVWDQGWTVPVPVPDPEYAPSISVEEAYLVPIAPVQAPWSFQQITADTDYVPPPSFGLEEPYRTDSAAPWDVRWVLAPDQYTAEVVPYTPPAFCPDEVYQVNLAAPWEAGNLALQQQIFPDEFLPSTRKASLVIWIVDDFA